MTDRTEQQADSTAGELARLLEEAKRKMAAMTPREREELHQQQRESWVRGMAPTGDPRFD